MKTHLWLAALLSAALLTMIAAALTQAAPHQAANQSTIDFMGLDTDVTGNTATSLGSLDTCLQTSAGGTFQVDLLVDAIPPDRPMTAFGLELIYDPDLISVEGWDPNFLLAAGGDYQPFDSSDPTPDNDGLFIIAILDTSGFNETGPGVLARFTLKALKDGVSTLSLSTQINDGVLDDASIPVLAQTIGTATVMAGQPCPSPAPPPVTTSVLGAQPPEGGEDADAPAAGGDTGTPGAGEDVDPQGTGAGQTPTADQTSGVDSTPGTSGTPVRGAPTTAGTAEESEGDDGFPLWVLAPIIVAVLAIGGGGYILWRRARGTGNGGGPAAFQ